MSINNRELFKNNRLTEAICQFTFQSAIDESLLESFWLEMQKTKIYTEKTISPLVHFNINLQDRIPQQEIFNGLKIENVLHNKVIQVFSGNISIHQVGNYESWEAFSTDVKLVLTAFRKIFNQAITRVDLRAINTFDLEKNQDSNKYFKVGINYPTDNPYNYNFTIEQVFEANTKFGVIRGNSYNINEKVRKFLLDLNYVHLCMGVPIDLSDTSSIYKILEDGHLILHDLFNKSITEETKNLIR